MNLSLNEDAVRGLHPEAKREIKRQYKALDKQGDKDKQRNAEMKAMVRSLHAAGQLDKPIKDMDKFIDDTFPNKSKKITANKIHLNTYLEQEDYPWYVTYYEKYPIYEPAEGGYYYEGRQATESKGFDSREAAIEFAENEANEAGGFEKLGDGQWEESSKYIGSGAYIIVEPRKRYLKAESGKKMYESLLLENRFSSGKHLQYSLSVLLRNAIEDDDYDLVKKCLELAYRQIHTIIPNVYTTDDLNKELDELSTLSTDINDYNYVYDDDDDVEPEDEMQDEWNYALESFFDLCDSLGIWVCTEGDKYSHEDDEVENTDPEEPAIEEPAVDDNSDEPIEEGNDNEIDEAYLDTDVSKYTSFTHALASSIESIIKLYPKADKKDFDAATKTIEQKYFKD